MGSLSPQGTHSLEIYSFIIRVFSTFHWGIKSKQFVNFIAISSFPPTSLFKMPNTKPEYFFLSSRNPFQSFDHIHAHKHFIPSSSSYYPCLTLNPKFMVSFALFLHAILCFICFPDVFLPAFLTQSLILDRHGLHLHLKKITSPSDSSSNKPLTSF